MASVSFYIFQYFLEKNLIQTTEFSLQLVMDSITADMNELNYLGKWCGSNDTIADYLVTPKDSERASFMALEAYDRLKEEYQNSKISEYIKRIMISNNDNKFIQIIGKAHDFYYSDPEKIRNLDFFEPQLYSRSIKWIGIVEDPLAKSVPEQVIPVVRPIYSSYRASIIGWTYITVSTNVITDHFRNYSIPGDSNVYITIGNNTYDIKDGALIQVDLDYKPVKDITGVTYSNQASSTIVEDASGDKRTIVTYSSTIDGWSLSQSLSKEQFSQQKHWYYTLLIFICLLILLLGTLLTLYLNHIINVPINKIRRKIKQISSGDFSIDSTIEWDNELGDIGKGINILSFDVVNLMDKRISDEKQKNELEYQILLSQINPHFLYNTLNSIKWMATIQNASGIAEMVTSLARLLKKVSKETKQLTTIREELSLLEDYSLIQRYRYGGIISFEYNIESEDLYDCQILKFSLQPLVENAIFHGIEPKGEAGIIQISIRHQGEKDVIIEIMDDGIGMTTDQITKTLSGESDSSSTFFKKIGIANVNSRIKYTYGKEYGLYITSEIDNYTKMTIIIPYKI
jgi:two-component system sensor histidine kinase YesM